ncbi:MAG: hypothetical protein ABI632_05355 [Pseudolysinimonas sp.]
MQKHRIISLLSVLIMLIIPAMGWFLVAQPQLAAASLADQQRADAAAQVATSQKIVAALKADSAKLPELNVDLNELRTSIPAGIDPSGYIDGLSALAKVSGVDIDGLTVQDPIAYVPATPPDSAIPVAPAPDPSADPSATPPPPPPFPGIVTSPLIDNTNFVAIPVTLDVTGTSPSILRFVNGLQTNDRLFLVTTLTTEQGSRAQQLSGKIGGFIWAIPTGVVGKPRPVSTIVKSMEPAKPPAPPTPDPNATATPDPNATVPPAAP